MPCIQDENSHAIVWKYVNFAEKKITLEIPWCGIGTVKLADINSRNTKEKKLQNKEINNEI